VSFPQRVTVSPPQCYRSATCPAHRPSKSRGAAFARPAGTRRRRCRSRVQRAVPYPNRLGILIEKGSTFTNSSDGANPSKRRTHRSMIRMSSAFQRSAALLAAYAVRRVSVVQTCSKCEACRRLTRTYGDHGSLPVLVRAVGNNQMHFAAFGPANAIAAIYCVSGDTTNLVLRDYCGVRIRYRCR